MKTTFFSRCEGQTNESCVWCRFKNIKSTSVKDVLSAKILTTIIYYDPVVFLFLLSPLGGVAPPLKLQTGLWLVRYSLKHLE